MNFFEHHIGDYDEATSHLSAREDGIYHRLIRKYYAKEKPLPADIEKVQRLARCRDDEDRQAVADILHEFFDLQPDGYHQKTCDENLQRYRAGEPEREVKRANENNRISKHRLERSRLFEVIVAAGGHMPWNTKIDDLRAAAAAIEGRKGPPATASAEKPATPVRVTGAAPATPATATNSQYPVPTTQSPIPSPQGLGVGGTQPPNPEPPTPTPAPPPPKTSTTRAERGQRLPKDWLLPKAWGEWALREYPHWTVDIVRRIALKFANHWQSTTGRGATKLDWEKTWQNWCMDERTQRENPPPRAAKVTGAADKNDEAKRLLGFTKTHGVIDG